MAAGRKLIHAMILCQERRCPGTDRHWATVSLSEGVLSGVFYAIRLVTGIL